MGNTSESAKRIAEDRKLFLMENQPKTFLKVGVQPGDIVIYRIKGKEKGSPTRTVRAKVLKVYRYMIVAQNKVGYRECFNIGHYLCGQMKIEKRMSAPTDMRGL